jgi:hypothetical protein
MPQPFKPSSLEDWIGRSDIPLAAKVNRYKRKPKARVNACRRLRPLASVKLNNRRDKEWWVNGILIKLAEQPESNRAKLLTFSRRCNNYLRNDDIRRLNLRGFIGRLAPEHPDCFPNYHFRPKPYRRPAIWSVGALVADVWRL